MSRLPALGKLNVSKLAAVLAVAGLLVTTDGLGNVALYDTGLVIAICVPLVLALRAIGRRLIAQFLVEGWFGRSMLVILVVVTVSMFSCWFYVAIWGAWSMDW